MGGLIFLVRIRRTSVSGLLNVAHCLQQCTIQLNLGHVIGNITVEQILSEALCPFMERTDPGAKYFHKHFVKPDVLYISCILMVIYGLCLVLLPT